MKVHFFVPILIFSIHNFAFSEEFHVSPLGSDIYPGVDGKPFLTLTRARDAVRKINKNMHENIFVYLHGGEYKLLNPIVFDSNDSGYNGYKVIYRAAPGENPVISGGVKVTNLELYDSKFNIYRADMSGVPFREVYIDGKPAIRSRTPNKVYESTLCPCWPFVIDEKPKVKINKKYGEVLNKVPKEEVNNVEMVMRSQWFHQRVLIDKANVNNNNMEIIPRYSKRKFLMELEFYEKEKSNSFYFENAFSFIDLPYEWYYDLRNKFIYIALPLGAILDKINVIIPQSDTLINLKGSTINPVHDVSFENLTFQYSNWNNPSFKGVNMGQGADVLDGKQPKAIIDAIHVRRLSVINNVFKNSSGHGIKFFDVDDTDITGNEFDNIAANCIDIDTGGGRNPIPEKQSTNIQIWNNSAIKCGSQYSNGMFLMARNVRDLLVAHNDIHDMPYSGMQIGQQPGKIQDVGSGNNLILYNHIYDTNQIHGDGGGIYTLGGIQEGSVIAENFIHDIHQPEGHYKIDYIYLDNFTSKILVKNNVVKGGRAAERNGSSGNTLNQNVQCNNSIEKNSGIKLSYDTENDRNGKFSINKFLESISDECE
jgi:hypothetical protein